MRVRGAVACMLALALGACNRHQSALAPFGMEAASTRTLTIVLLIGAVVIGLSVAGLMQHAIRTPGDRLTHRQGMRIVLWLGAVVPTLVLFTLLVASLPLMRPAPVAEGDLRIAVEGEQFWWRVRYAPPGEAPVTTANEIRVPVGRTTVFELGGGDVIHSFWIPGLAGKMDMIPGRTNTLVTRPTKAGRYRGVCTEFCGLSHALMAFDVIAMEPAAFDIWLAEQRRGPANLPAGSLAERGARAFWDHGCTGCHAITDTTAKGEIGPDLTHVGSRPSLGAGTLPMTRAALVRFIRDAPGVKPGARMPAFPQLSDDEAVALAAYLENLK